MKTIEEIREYLDRDYWERGQSLGKSGYENFSVNWWWVNRWLQCFTEVIPIKDRKVLDLGCGVGGMVAGFLTWGGDAYGIDLSDYAIEKGKTQCEFLKGRLFQGSCHDLSMFPDNFFHIIYSNQVFEHVPEQHIPQMRGEIWRVMRWGGIGWFAFQMPVEGRRGENDPDETHVTMYPRQWWEEKFLGVGFTLDARIDRRMRKTRTGPDNYSYFEYYQWATLVVRKPFLKLVWYDPGLIIKKAVRMYRLIDPKSKTDSKS